MDWTDLLSTVAKGWLRLTASVAIGITIGGLLEFSGWLNSLAKVLPPSDRQRSLPAVCTSSFIMALASPRSANSLLASWHIDGLLSRRSLILGGISHTLPASSVHFRSTAFIIIPLLGAAGLGYVLFQFLVNGLCFASALLLGRFWKEDSRFSGTPPKGQPADLGKIPAVNKQSAADLYKLLRRRFVRIYARVMMISFPIYILVTILFRYGVFNRLNRFLPLDRLLPAAGLGIISAHLGGVLNAVAAARPFLEEGLLSGLQVFTALIIGYVISLPLRTLRHVLPSALGIFPGKTGLYIVAYTQGFKMLCAVGIILIFLPLGAFQ